MPYKRLWEISTPTIMASEVILKDHQATWLKLTSTGDLQNITRGKGINKIQLRKIWVVSEEIVSNAIDKNTQMCKYHTENSLSCQLSTNDRIPWYRRINSVFFTETLLAQTTPSTCVNKYSQIDTPNYMSVTKYSSKYTRWSCNHNSITNCIVFAKR